MEEVIKTWKIAVGAIKAYGVEGFKATIKQRLFTLDTTDFVTADDSSLEMIQMAQFLAGWDVEKPVFSMKYINRIRRLYLRVIEREERCWEHVDISGYLNI